MILTYRYRVRSRSAERRLERMAEAVNLVWNFCGDTQENAKRWGKRWPSAYDLMKLAAGTNGELGISNEVIETTCMQFVQARRAAGRRPRWRGRHSLGWVPFRHDWAVTVDGDRIRFGGHWFRVWKSRPLGGPIKAGSFSQDARGRWYVNLACEVAETKGCGAGSVGVDLGLKDLAALSDGTKIANPRHFDRRAKALARAQRAGNKRRARAIAAKIANGRRHHLHEQSIRLVRQFGRIVVGNVNAAALKRTRMAKSVGDAGWSMFRNMLRYKAIAHGAEYVEADERYSSQTCSDCGSISGPKGRKGLEIRVWECGDCGSVHDRDVNAARNILGRERPPLVAGIAAFREHVNNPRTRSEE